MAGFLERLRHPFGRKRSTELVTVDGINDLKRLMPGAMTRMLNASSFKSITPGDTLSNSHDGQPIFKSWSTDKAVQEGYRVSTWVYACVFRNARSAAGVPWRTEEKIAGRWTVTKEPRPVVQLLENPNPHWTRQDLMERLSMHLHLGGDGYMTKVRGGGVPRELWLIAPDKIEPIASQRDFISGYEASRDGRVIRTLPPEDVIHMMFSDPACPYKGISPLEAAARAVDTDNTAMDHQKISLDNRAMMDGVLTSAEPLTDTQFESARTKLREQHQGSKNSRLPMVLSGEWKFHNFSFNAVEMDFMRSRAFSQVEICSAFGVPPPVIGLLGDATMANIQMCWVIYWLGTVLPYLEDIRDSLNRGLTPEFGEPEIRLNFDISKVAALRELFRQDVETASKLWMMGVPFQDLNHRLDLGFQEFPRWDVSYVPLNMVPSENAGLNRATAGSLNVQNAADVLRARAKELLNGDGRVVEDAIAQLADVLANR